MCTHTYIYICTRSAYMSQMYTAGLYSSFPDLLYSKHANTNGLSHQPVAKCVRIAVPINNTRRKTCPNHWVYKHAILLHVIKRSDNVRQV